MILLIDNYDSFSYNLYQLLGELTEDITVVRNDKCSIEDIERLAPELLVLSPGPGRPENAGICVEAVRHFAGKIPIFGVCLGHQAICQAFGGTVSYAKELMHGKQSEIYLENDSRMFRGMPKSIPAARYHSLSAEAGKLPDVLRVTAVSADGEVMAVEHKEYPVYGVQFHPESVMTPDGLDIIRNIMDIKKEEKKEEADMIREAILKLAKREDLTYQEAEQVMNEVMEGEASPVQMSSYLTALSLKGETIEEITASAAGMRAHCIKLLHEMDVLEIVGTGGDGANSFNISTTSALVISAAGVPVAKHGNRAASSRSGAADVLEALGVNITVAPEVSAKLLKDINICFLFAQNYHIAMKYVAPIRKELGIRTVFNILGPLSNPAGANMELMGVYDEALVEPLAKVMSNLGVTRGMVVYGEDCLDEISMSAPTRVCEIRDGEMKTYTITPEQFGYTRCDKTELVGGTPQENAQITLDILEGRDQGPKRQAVCMNAGAAFYLVGKAQSLEEGVRLAEKIIDSGAAREQLKRFVEESSR